MNAAPQTNPEYREIAPPTVAPAPEHLNVAATADVFATQAETVGQTAEIMGSVESSEITVESAENAESAEGGEGYGEGEQTGKGKVAHGGPTVVLPPPPTAMIPTSDKALRHAVAAAIRAEIREDEKQVFLAYVGWEELPADRLAALLARIRSLKNLLATLISATTDALKSLYLKWVEKANG